MSDKNKVEIKAEMIASLTEAITRTAWEEARKQETLADALRVYCIMVERGVYNEFLRDDR